jgi:site-specific DNA-methyltransferase (adenine-specific)
MKYPEDYINKIICGDCLEVMKGIPDKSVDLVLTDLPYGTTQCKWDSVIPFNRLWEQYERIIKSNGLIILTGSQPFTSALILSNPKMFKYCMIYKKTKATGFFDAKKRPLNDYEDICVFYKKQPTYNPQMSVAKKIYKRGFVQRKKSDCYGEEKNFEQKESGQRYPKRIIEIQNADTSGIKHPTQKPVSLFEYLIMTYTNESDLILDNCIGSGTTAVACIKTKRNFIGIEQDDEYCEIAQRRLAQEYIEFT